MFLFRGFAIIATALPNPDYTCVPRITYPENVWLEAVQVFLKVDLTCQDVLYSGHTVAITLAMLFVAKYSSKSPWSSSFLSGSGWFSRQGMLRMACMAYTFFGYYCIIASHFHFTVDVFIGSLMSCIVFISYHHAIEVAPLRMRHTFSPYRFLLWFEQPALDMILWHKVAARRLEAMNKVDADLSCQVLQEGTPAFVVNSGLDRLMRDSMVPLPPIYEDSLEEANYFNAHEASSESATTSRSDLSRATPRGSG